MFNKHVTRSSSTNSKKNKNGSKQNPSNGDKTKESSQDKNSHYKNSERIQILNISDNIISSNSTSGGIIHVVNNTSGGNTFYMNSNVNSMGDKSYRSHNTNPQELREIVFSFRFG